MLKMTCTSFTQLSIILTTATAQRLFYLFILKMAPQPLTLWAVRRITELYFYSLFFLNVL